ncbi:HNH endonuclease signature motif containing protein [Microbacterium sp. HJ5]
MTDLGSSLNEVRRVLGEVVIEAFDDRVVARLSDDDLLAALVTLAGIHRQTEALIAEVVGQVDERADAAPHPERITTVHGCRSVNELVQRVTLVSRRTAGELLRAGRGITMTTAPTTGEALDADYPAMRIAAAQGAVGIDGLVAVIDTLAAADCSVDARRRADKELAASARGALDGAQPCADELRLQASVWAMYLDPDGAEPREARAMRKRGLTLGVCRDGLVPLRGSLLPEVAGQLGRIFDSLLNPKVDAAGGPAFVESEAESDAPPDAAGDGRSRSQKQHDALATALTVAARAGELPTIGGAAPTLVVSVRADDVERGRGYAHIDGCDEPLPVAIARQVACTGAVQRVHVDAGGRILAIGVADRVFAAHQRKAIALRDGGCIIPGCGVPAAWCEIHHVHEAARGGPTHTDNGVLLCWFHHRTIDTGGWKVRMNRGVPEIRGPAWWDSSARWHPATKSPTRLLDRREARRGA